MEQTSNYQLNQWAESDRILRTDFNSDNAKIEAALADKLGKIELIQTVTATSNSTALVMDLTSFAWSDWSILFFQFRCGASNYSNTLRMYLGGASGIGYLAELTQRNNMLGILFPGRNAAERVCAVGFPGGQLGISTSTYSQIEKMQVSITPTYMDGSEQLLLYGIH